MSDVRLPRPRHRAAFRGAACGGLLLAALSPLRGQAPGTNLSPPPSARATTVRVASLRALAERIDAVLDRPELRRAHWGIEVRDAATGAVLYQRNAAKLFVPASNLKLVVAAAAAHHLPGDYRFRTSLLATGPVREGTLEGDLVLYGRGDPMLSARYYPSRTAVFEELADSLLARGVRRVSGGVVADESYFEAEHLRGDWEAYDLRWWYAAPVSALGFNDNSIDFRVEPGQVGEAARITAQPESGFFALENRTRTVARGRPYTLDFERAGPGRVRAYGEIPLDAGTRTESFAVDDPAAWTGTVLRETLEAKGIRFGRAAVRVVSDPALSPAGRATPLAEHLSPPLPQAIAPILLNSQNWFAEQLLKTLGKEVRGEASWEAGLAVERDFLTGVVGVDSADFALRDGSGLSAGNLVTPRALVQLLAYIRSAPEERMVRESLPVSGRAGSLQARLTDLPGRVAAKTGYIGNVDSLSGFVTLADGRQAVFSVVANASGQPSSRVKAGIDDVVRAIAAGAP